MENTKTTSEIIIRAEETLFTAKLGLPMLTDPNPSRRRAGLRDIIVFGRSVTFVLQNLRSIEPGFDMWYARYTKEMEKDALMGVFKNLRNEILKEGRLELHSHSSFSGTGLQLMNQFPPPPGAKGFFIGDRNGGSGWEVELPDGHIEKYYVDVQQEIPGVRIETQIYITDAPEEYQHQPAQLLCEHYLSYLENMVRDAKQCFINIRGDR